jgi:hypothetical protein
VRAGRTAPTTTPGLLIAPLVELLEVAGLVVYTASVCWRQRHPPPEADTEGGGVGAGGGGVGAKAATARNRDELWRRVGGVLLLMVACSALPRLMHAIYNVNEARAWSLFCQYNQCRFLNRDFSCMLPEVGT